MHPVATNHRSPAGPTAVHDGYTDMDGRRFYRISDYDRMPPFFMTIVGSGDTWLFLSSSGGVTAGRVQPDSALFPYYTDDKVTESAGRTGGLTLIRVAGPGGDPVLWEPFLGELPAGVGARRNLYKDVLGTELVFEEVRPDLGLRLRVAWSTGARFGIVRRCELASVNGRPVSAELLDGFVNILPAGVDVAVQNRLSSLLDAYKRSEYDVASGLGLYWLSSRLTDLAEPSESLFANVVWQVGLDPVSQLLTTSQLAAFRAGRPVLAEHDVRGQRGAYLVQARVHLAPGAVQAWSVVGDVEADTAAAVALRLLLGRPQQARAELEDDLRSTRAELERIVATADGVQCTADEPATAHHAANVLFNVMRGGVPADGYRISVADLGAFLRQRSRRAHERAAGVLAGLGDGTTVQDLREAAAASGDPDLIRLAAEYLPLTFSRRHGDPSRPWNRFRIALRDANGGPLLNHEGNWRDIFQNWEALAWSFPEYLESMVTVFLDATTADGYNPYRISRAGIDWEVPDPDDPWANIGYWSDHQVVYLLRLMEASTHFHPGRLRALLGQPIFTHADVPYRIAGYDRILQDPQSTITYDQEHAARVARRVEALGADGRLVHGPDGELVRVTAAEKLLLLLLAKLVNLVPDGGIWMNTQRPEWNDANNALVGRGLSVVTLAQIRRYVAFLAELITDDVTLSEELVELAGSVSAALAEHRGDLRDGFTATTRRGLMDRLGSAGTAYRERVYAGLAGRSAVMPAAEVGALLDLAGEYVDATLRRNRRPDGLYHSYNLLDLGEATADVRHLAEMLEGQVAVLSSGLLDPEESVALLAALRASALYRADQHSYQLYPDRDLPGFLTRNRFTAERAASCPLVAALVAAGDRSVVVPDVAGDLHFAATIRNERDVQAALDRLARRPELGAAVADGREELLAIFEEVFVHSEFTGRSGSFFAYEGLGSIYWHMVSKLLLAISETLERAAAENAPAPALGALAAAYEDVRAGLGYCKGAALYGAFPADPYSHTPAGHGARQPGMTGQVKEEVLTRFAELGLRVEQGRIVLRPLLLRPSEWTTSSTVLPLTDQRGEQEVLGLPEGSLAFTFCQVPVLLQRADRSTMEVHLRDGRVVACPDGAVDAALSASVFGRTGQVALVRATVPDTASLLSTGAPGAFAAGR
jgi:hypothetical protein